MALTTGEIIEGKYRIVRLIGEGGMGAVYEGENTRIHRRVAIKVLHQGVAENQEAVQRFEREAQAAGRIGNDHILEVLDLGELSNGERFMVMEYLDGEPLSERIRRVGKMRPAEITPLIIQVLEGLKAAHGAGIVHRDLKPDNVFVLKEKAGQHDFVKLIDFGISKFLPLGGNEMKMTRTGTVMGTPYYMSPEQASGSREADHRSDLYAVGVILYEAVVGRVPFDAPTFNQLLFQIVLSDPPPPQQLVPDLDTGFANLIAKAMARDVAHRFQSAVDFSNALLAWLKTGASVSLPPASPANPLVPRAGTDDVVKNKSGSRSTREMPAGTSTPESWSSQPSRTAQQQRSKALLFAGLGALFVLLALSAAFTRWLLRSDARSTTAAATVSASSTLAQPAELPRSTASVSDATPQGVVLDAAPQGTAITERPAASALDVAAESGPEAKPSLAAGNRSTKPTLKPSGHSDGAGVKPAKRAPRGQPAPVDFGY